MSCGFVCAMLVRRGLKSLLPPPAIVVKASSSVTVPPACSKKVLNPPVRPAAYGLSSWIVAAFVNPSLV